MVLASNDFSVALCFRATFCRMPFSIFRYGTGSGSLESESGEVGPRLGARSG